MDIQEVLRKHKLWFDGLEGGERADLRRADLCGANLCGADLRGADLRGASLCGANLCGASLRGANLYRASLRGANLRGADLRRANLCGANLCGASLCGADLRGANLPAFAVCPEEGDFIGWKKLGNGVVAKLLIPAAARRTSSLVGRKCRAEYVVVVDGEGVSEHDGWTKYSKGMTTFPDGYDDDIRVECTSGIHFFITKKEAEDY